MKKAMRGAVVPKRGFSQNEERRAPLEGGSSAKKKDIDDTDIDVAPTAEAAGKKKGQKYIEMAERGMQKQKELAEKAKQRMLDKQGDQKRSRYSQSQQPRLSLADRQRSKAIANKENKETHNIRSPSGLNDDIGHVFEDSSTSKPDATDSNS